MAKNFEELTEILNNNTAELEKVLSGIGEKLDVITEDSGAVDLIRVYLSELKKILEEQYSISAAKSDHIEGVFKNLEGKLDDFYDKSPEKEELILLVSSIKSELEKNIRKDIKEGFSGIEAGVKTAGAHNSDYVIETMSEAVEGLKVYLKELSAIPGNQENITQNLKSIENFITESSKTYNEKFEALQTSLCEYSSVVDEASKSAEKKLSGSLTEINGVKSELGSILDEVQGVSGLEKKITAIISDISKLGNSVNDGMKESFEEHIELIDNKFEKLLKVINNIKHNDELDEAIAGIEEKIAVLRQEVNLINTDILEVFNAKTEEILRGFEPLKIDIAGFFECNFDKIIEELKTQIEFSYLNVSNDIHNGLTGSMDSVEKLSDVYKETLDKVTAVEESIADQLQNNLELIRIAIESVNKTVDLNLDKTNSFIDEFKKKLDKMSAGDASASIDKLRDELTLKFDDLIMKVGSTGDFPDSKINETLLSLHEKVDALSDDFDIVHGLEGLKELISEQKSLYENETVMSDCLESLKNKITELESAEFKNTADLKESILTAISSVFTQISFVEETEEIKDFVEEKTDEITQHLQEMSAQLKKIAEADGMSEYSYTLQDVESDIAKLRMVLSDISSSNPQGAMDSLSENINKIALSVDMLQASLTQEQMYDLRDVFEKLNEEIISLSSRTNKILLNSDESCQALSSGLDKFSDVVYQLEDKISVLDSSESHSRLEQKLDNVYALTASNVNANRVFHKVMMYLGEWIDSTTESISGISDKTSTIKEVKDLIHDLKLVVPEKTMLFKELEEKFEEQQLRLDRLEKKLDSIVLAQKEGGGGALNLDKVEKQLAKLGKSVEKLAAYVE